MFKRVMIHALLVVSLSNCGQEGKEEAADTRVMRDAVAQMAATTGNNATGMVTFAEVAGGIQVVARFEGVPEGEHGFHIHEKGDCSSGDGTSAGGHWNPEGVDHAGRDAATRHVGDLGNISADADDVAKAEFVDIILTFDGANSIIGKGFILHVDEDDLISQPAGAAGARISCGVIEWAPVETSPL